MWLPLTWPPQGTWPTTQACALTGNGTTIWFSACAQSSEPHQPGQRRKFLNLTQRTIGSQAGPGGGRYHGGDICGCCMEDLVLNNTSNRPCVNEGLREQSWEGPHAIQIHVPGVSASATQSLWGLSLPTQEPTVS